MGGIYFIFCNLNDKTYVGSAKNLHKRWGEHKNMLTIKRHYNINLQRAWDKYGEHAFSYSIKEELGEYDKKFFFQRENFWIDSLKDNGQKLFNIARAEGGWGDETKLRAKEIGAKISASLTKTMNKISDEERKQKYGHRRGIPLAEDLKKNLSEFWKNKPKSADTKNKMKIAQQNISEELRNKKIKNMSRVGKERIGSVPPNAKPICFRGIRYSSSLDCKRQTGISIHEILKEVYGPNYRKKEKNP